MTPGPLPGGSTAFGKSVAAWQELYWRWYYGDISLAPDNNGNAVVNGVVLMPQPSTPGDGTPGSIDVSLNAGQPFMLPLWNVLGTSYNNGTPTDPAIPLSVFRTLDITFKIDGVTIIDRNNVMDFYAQFDFIPPIALPPEFSPYLAIVWGQTTGLLRTPLTVGTHTMTLDEKNTQLVYDGQGFSYTFEYHNTWHITVKP
jgi:hypothetical protein